ncbi:MAG TPA: four helix bundle protein [Candidatus Paceibacterota bacterium]|nr:four helix bundle protein [Candidatus Paceibacterota bacterium]
MKIEKFEDILAWQKSKELTLSIYKTLKDCRDYSFRDQIQRAAVSVMNNIAEGFERHTNKEFISFLYIAKGSCGEVRSMLDLGLDLGYFTKKEHDNFKQVSIDASKLISGFIKVL